jgi:hypothetical protein
MIWTPSSRCELHASPRSDYHTDAAQPLPTHNIFALRKERYTTDAACARLEMLSLEPPKHHRCLTRNSEQSLQFIRVCRHERDEDVQVNNVT